MEVLSLLSDDVETEYASPGENLKLRLKGIEEEEILPGFILCNADNLCHSGRTFDAQVMIPALTVKIMNAISLFGRSNSFFSFVLVNRLSLSNTNPLYAQVTMQYYTYIPA